MADAPSGMRELIARPLTVEAFARYGRVIAAPGTGIGVNGGTSLRTEAVPELDLHREDGRAVLAVYDAQARAFPFEARVLERHRLSDQAFLPLGAARRCVLLVAPADAEPSPGACEAFVTDGRQGVLIRAGTWHHGLLALDAGPWAVLERRARDGALDNEERALPVTLRLGLPA